MHIPTLRRCTVAALFVAIGGCTESSIMSPEPPLEEAATVLSTRAEIGDVADRAAFGPIRLEIDVRAGGPPWIAREVEVEDDADNEEEIESRIVAADRSAGTVELELDGLVVAVSGARKFRAEGVGDITEDAFFTRVETALVNRHRPGVELRRPLPGAAQAPEDRSFMAADVRLDSDAQVGKLEVLVDARHFTSVAAGTGRIRVFGIDIVVDPALGTEVWTRTEDGDGAFEIEGLVADADPASGRVALLDGRTFHVTGATRFDDDDGDDLASLAEVAAALRGGHWVEAEAEVVAATDGSWTAVEVEFEIEDDADDDDLPGAFEFESVVTSVDVGSGALVLASGATFTLTTTTRIESDGDLRSLQEVADALSLGLEVEAEGSALVDSSAPGGVRLLEIEFEVDDADDFEGELAAVDPAAGAFSLASGRTYLVTSMTAFDSQGDLFTLAAAADALAAGAIVEVEGDAVPDASAPGGWLAIRVKIEVDD